MDSPQFSCYLLRLWVIVRILLVELGVINIELFHNIHDAHNAWRLGVGVVEESLLADLHGLHVVPGRVVPHAVPAGGGVWLGNEVVDAELHVDPVLEPALRLRLDEPVAVLGAFTRPGLFSRTHSGLLHLLLSLSLANSAGHFD